ncbi:unnamed protein product [Heligmosomoides polygyrus]|uniref:F-box domain-containing protein n=1 Tax=Heligmosomoides polygyrus TaxID=6339 RepID=A0A183G3M0_HELPZ|nr:unnamed protein product [Heligmosomoides polygyrus]
MDLSHLPEAVLVNMLRQASPTTVITAKRLNKKMHRIVERNHLAKPRVDEFNVEVRTFFSRTRPIGKLQLKNGGAVQRRLVVTMKRRNKSRQVVEEGVEGPSSLSGTHVIGEEMKKVKGLSFDGITADTAFFSMLTAKWNDLRSLTLDFCHFEQDIITDKVIASMPQLRTLRVQPRSSVFHRHLTDTSVRNWGSSPPHTIALYNCSTSITLQGIFDMIKAVDVDTAVDWDFGRVLPSEGADGQLFSMLSIPGLTILVSDDFRSRRVQMTRGTSRIAFNLTKEEAYTS